MRLHITTDLTAGAIPVASPLIGRTPVARRLLVLLTAAAFAGAGVAAFQAGPGPMDPDLARVIRAMALIKAGFALAAFAACLWRLARPTRPWRTAIYVAGPPLMVAGAIGLFSLHGLPVAAIGLHLGLFAVLTAGLTDPDFFDGWSRRREA